MNPALLLSACNLFVAVEPKGGKRVIKITETRTKPDYAHFIKELLEKHYPEAISVKLVTDNLNTHFATSFYETFSKEQAGKLLERIDFYYTPKHASWLNMAEIEINVMDRQCTGGRIANQKEIKTVTVAIAKAESGDTIIISGGITCILYHQSRNCYTIN